jgi:hypothetical protein
MVSALFVVGNGNEIVRDRLVLEMWNMIHFSKETVDLFNCQWRYNSSLTIVVYKRSCELPPSVRYRQIYISCSFNEGGDKYRGK